MTTCQPGAGARWAVIGLFCALSWGAGAAELRPSALAVSLDGSEVYVAETGAQRLDVVSTVTNKVVRSITVAGAPNALLLSRDGKQLYVARGEHDAAVDVIDRATGKLVGSTPVGHTPTALVLAPDGQMLYVCARFANRIDVLSPGARRLTAQIAVPREPIAAAISADGKRLFVANHLPAGRSDAEQVAAELSVIDTDTRKVVQKVDLPSGSSSLRGMTITPDGRWVLITHLLSRFELPTTQVDRGWMNTNALTVVDAKAATRYRTVLLDDVDLGAANPWGLGCTADGKRLVIAHAGTHELSVMDWPAMLKKMDAKADVSTDLAFLVGLRERIPTAGKGPRALVVSGDQVYAADYYADALSRVDLSAARLRANAVPLGEPVQLGGERLGEALFNDAELCFQKWQSCASCHPDGRADGFNWDLMNDGQGNPRNTKSMLRSHATPPSMITGIRKTAEEAVRSGLRFILFTVRPEADATSIDTYLKSLKPVVSPYRVGGRLSRSATRGEALFRDAQVGCAGCHSGPNYTDQAAHDVGTGQIANERLDTPALVEAWRTAPYLNDGRAVTMEEVLTRDNPKDRHGKTSHLSKAQLLDLVEYILSL